MSRSFRLRSRIGPGLGAKRPATGAVAGLISTRRLLGVVVGASIKLAWLWLTKGKACAAFTCTRAGGQCNPIGVSDAMPSLELPLI